MNTFRLYPKPKGSCELLEIVIDDIPLADYFAELSDAVPDYVSPLGWANEEQHNQNECRRFLLEAEPDLPNRRNSILICPIDGDLLCGAYSAVFRKEENCIFWSAFAYEWPDFASGTQEMTFYEQLSPFTFLWEQYEPELRKYITF